MTFNNTLSTLITDTNNNIALLKGLQAQNQSETLSTTDPFTDDPTVDTTGLWTLAQTTFNTTDNLYIGIYKINGSFSCATIDIVSVNNFTAPGDGIGAQYKACGASTFTNVATPNALEGVNANTIIVRSTSAFTVTLRLAAKWCYSIDFTQQQGITQKLVGGVYTSGQGWVSSCFGPTPGYASAVYNVTTDFKAVLNGARLTEITVIYDSQPKNATIYVATIRKDVLTTILKQQPVGSGNDKVITWTGDAVFETLFVTVGLSNGSSPADCNYSGRIKTLTAKGIGACPFGTPTCTA